MASDKPTLNPVFVVIAGEAPNREYFVRLQIRHQGFKIGHSYLEGKDEEPEQSAEGLAAELRKALEAFVMELMDEAAAQAKAHVRAQLDERLAHGQETKAGWSVFRLR
ncbi:hypothetical protein LCGC14_1218000 [marine sediment metagenome]|uniref:Uncharacterized protein n=1 Tax=marine sediment metagenome TaxID=412755 RepID=A0A0F9NUC0_9ZZZZ